MTQRKFTMRLACDYKDPDNMIDNLNIEVHTQDGWQPLGLSETSPGFQIFVYSVFTCQHMFFRTNCAERGLMLEKSEGSIMLATDSDWNIENLHIEFAGELKRGLVNQDDIDYIVGRMEQCPVSKNTREIADNVTRITFNSPSVG